ncbi:MAG: hypothetical protein R3B47_03340 [Bacteroidia bacterium]
MTAYRLPETSATAATWSLSTSTSMVVPEFKPYRNQINTDGDPVLT